MNATEENAQQINGIYGLASSVLAGSSQTIPGTELKIDTLLTRLGSLDVPISMPRGPLVYFVRRAGAVKIGFTHRLSQRFMQLGGNLRLLGTVQGTETTERMYHHRFAHLRMHGEWFRAEQNLLDTIKNEAAMPPPLKPTYHDIAQAFIKQSRKDLRAKDHRFVTLQTTIGFWLNMLTNGETPERLAGLEQALSALEARRIALNQD